MILTGFLRPGGLVAPSQCSIMVSAMYDQDIERKRTFWQDVYGFKMTAMQEKLFEDADISFFPEDVVRSQVVSLKVCLQGLLRAMPDVDYRMSMCLP